MAKKDERAARESMSLRDSFHQAEFGSHSAAHKNCGVLLINPPFFDKWDKRRLHCLGLGYISSALKEAGFDTAIIDANLWRQRPTPAQLVQWIQKNVYTYSTTTSVAVRKIIGISVVAPVYQQAIEIARLLKAIYPNVLLIFGGHHATARHREILKEESSVDIVVRGEGEITTVELVKVLLASENAYPEGCGEVQVHSLANINGISFRIDDIIQINPDRCLVSLDDLPFPDRSSLGPVTDVDSWLNPSTGQRAMRHTVLSSRGCTRNCAFCAVGAFYGKCRGQKWRARSPESVVDEIEHLIHTDGAKFINFVDADFLVSAERAINIAQLIHERNLEIKFTFATRSDVLLNHSQCLPALKQAGCVMIELGIESGSQSVLDYYRKGLTVETNAKAIAVLKKHGIHLGLDFIMFAPHTTIEEIEENLLFIEQNNCFWHEPMIFYSTLAFYPGTPIAEARRNSNFAEASNTESIEFQDLRTARVFRYMMTFRDRFQSRIDIACDALHRQRCLHHIGKQKRRGIYKSRALSSLIMTWSMLRRAPFQFAKFVVQSVGAGGNIDEQVESYMQAFENSLIQIEKEIQANGWDPRTN